MVSAFGHVHGGGRRICLQQRGEAAHENAQRHRQLSRHGMATG
jgi:hypothetical protein